MSNERSDADVSLCLCSLPRLTGDSTGEAAETCLEWVGVLGSLSLSFSLDRPKMADNLLDMAHYLESMQMFTVALLAETSF